ncbi:hypothetical protein BDP27DRAFT_1311868 [Rhodocollybia butyracea]|uniref:DRBM domain-containing protein n=1 Tax=Rhodocollybia butyracea TaxID=206335 RepID=A0A9P5Q2F4_9AGAR|nr:hypothetical protein BDP27DRAFT_1311868 [Rhodocollybia butyracea]
MEMHAGHTHSKMLLNNYAQDVRCGPVFYDNRLYGPLNACVWESIVYLNNQEYGRGRGRSRLAAEEQAASQALRAIRYGY